MRPAFQRGGAANAFSLRALAKAEIAIHAASRASSISGVRKPVLAISYTRSPTIIAAVSLRDKRGLAQHPQRVIGFRKIQVVAHGLLTASLIKARRSKFQRAREPDQQQRPCSS